MTGPILAEPAFAGIPTGLRAPLLTEYNKLCRHFREGRWEPAELNGGKLCEIVYSILKGHVDGKFADSPFKPSNMVDACRALEQAGSSFPRSVRIQIPRVLLALYEIRNNRNVGHVGADVDPNHMDAAVVVGMMKWVLAELVRIFHNTTPQQATEVVESLTERTIPILWKVGDVTRVLSNLSVKDKTLVLLYGSTGDTAVRVLLQSLEYKNHSRFRTTILKPAHKEGLLHHHAREDTVTLSPLGTRYVEANVPLELPD